MNKNTGKTVEHFFNLILIVVGGIVGKKIWDKKQNS